MATMTFPEDTIPLDVMIAHQIRMVTNNPAMIEHVVVDNRPPWMEPVNRQEAILQLLERSGSSRVRRVDYSTYRTPSYMQRFFETGAPSDSIATLEGSRDTSDIDGHHLSSNMQGMLSFLEHCLGSAGVDLCMFLDPDIMAFRQGRGMVEMAREAFAASDRVVGLSPPTICSGLGARNHSRFCARRPSFLSQRYLILHRQRLAHALPLRVPRAELFVKGTFEWLLTQGMRHIEGGHAAWRLLCAGAFAVHPFSARWSGRCLNRRENWHIQQHARLTAASANLSAAVDHHGFEGVMVEGLREIIARVEAGRLPRPENSASITNMCEDMCVSPERVARGLAW